MSARAGKKSSTSKAKRKVGETRPAHITRTRRISPAKQNPIIAKCKRVLKKYYGARLKGVVLYGSMARREATSTSDIDLLVLLSPPLDFFAELRHIVDVLYPLQLESEHLISAKPVLASDFEAGTISLYRNAKREGVAV